MEQNSALNQWPNQGGSAQAPYNPQISSVPPYYQPYPCGQIIPVPEVKTPTCFKPKCKDCGFKEMCANCKV